VTRSAAGLTRGELAGVAAVLRAADVAVVGPLKADVIEGGRSNLTFSLTDGVSRWVMRTPPRLGRTPSAHDVAREFRVTAALAASQVPVPHAVALCEDETVLGGPFAIADFVPGRTIQTQFELAELDDAAVAHVTESLVATLAALHQVDHIAIGLERFGRPDSYAQRQLARWSTQWQLVGTSELRRLAESLVKRLTKAMPPQRSTRIVHGDFRIDNTILDLDAPGGPCVAAVVDWELSTIGDPVADVAMMCAYRNKVFDLIVGQPSAWTSDRLPDPDALVAAYLAAGGLTLHAWEFHLALAYFKLAVIAAGIEHRRLAGAGSGRGFDTSGQSVPTYLEFALATLESGD
jgi:aminoglycoside phosphotransferase (APT) family kinase protein